MLDVCLQYLFRVMTVQREEYAVINGRDWMDGNERWEVNRK